MAQLGGFRRGLTWRELWERMQAVAAGEKGNLHLTIRAKGEVCKGGFQRQNVMDSGKALRRKG